MSRFHRKTKPVDPDLEAAKEDSARERRVASWFRDQARDAAAHADRIVERVNAHYEENDVRNKLHRTFGGP